MLIDRKQICTDAKKRNHDFHKQQQFGIVKNFHRVQKCTLESLPCHTYIYYRFLDEKKKTI